MSEAERGRIPFFALFYFLNFCGSTRGFRGSSLGQKWHFYGALRRSWDLPFHFQLIKLSMVNFYGLAEVGGSWSNHLVFAALLC